MPLRMVNVLRSRAVRAQVRGPITARMADIGGALGSASIGLVIQTVKPGCWSSRRHRHIFQDGWQRYAAPWRQTLPVRSDDAFCYLPSDPEPHLFENTGSEDLVVWAFPPLCQRLWHQSLFSFSMISGGVFLGAASPFQTVTA